MRAGALPACGEEPPGDASNGAGGQGGGDGGGSTLPPHGQVFATSDTDGSSYLVIAAFYEGLEAPPCLDSVVEGCTVRSCSSGPEEPFYEDRSAGHMTITSPLAHVAIDPVAGGYVADGDEPLWTDAGQWIHVEATGADVPAFSLDVAAPSRLLVTEPALPHDGQPLTLAVREDLHVAWSQGTDSGRVVVGLWATDQAVVVSVSCPFLPTAGQGTVPAEALQKLPYGPDTHARLSVDTESRETKTAGEWTVEVELRWLGDYYDTDVHLQ